MSRYISEIAITKSGGHFADVLTNFDIELNLKAPLLTTKTGHLVNDSRVLNVGDIFCAIVGHDLNGNDYIEMAIDKGVSFVLSQCEHLTQHGDVNFLENSNVPIISFYRLDSQLLDLANAYYEFPQQKLSIVGITGTNGKTSTSQIVASLLESLEESAAVIGTTGAGKLASLTPIVNTTPGSSELLTILAQFNALNVNHVAMEVSSHALTQGRVTADLFDVAVFTNLSRDHLDYHQTMAAYAEAKFSIFTLKAGQVAVINGDDENAQTWLKAQCDFARTDGNLVVFGQSKNISANKQYVKANNVTHSAAGLAFTLETHLGNVEVISKLLGDFNVENLLAAISVLIAKGFKLESIAKAVASVQPVIGRMETFIAENRATAVVDYAHTPDALENALIACKQHCAGELWVVFGCGGNRDKGKRPQMGKIAERIATHVIVTNDNPRNEKPEDIAQDILDGCEQPNKVKVLLNRQKAVIEALSAAKDKDVVLVAGKGHETSIVIGDEVIPYDERALVQKTYQIERLS